MKQILSLNGKWEMFYPTQCQWIPATVPGSVYSVLMENGLMEDPYWRDNECRALKRMEEDYTFQRLFVLTGETLEADEIILCCKGIDTIAQVSINGTQVLYCNNMHRQWEIDAKPYLQAGENQIKITVYSPTRYIRQAYEKDAVEGTSDAMRGFPHIRKAHCMYGWDWGPRLPDAGIWRDIELQAVKKARLKSVGIVQEHIEEQVVLSFRPEIDCCKNFKGNIDLDYMVTAPTGEVINTTDTLRITNPMLWWPKGYGAQPLYVVTARLWADGELVDSCQCRIGLRTMTIKREKDKEGESFAINVNGSSIFAMGADYIPEDNIFSRIQPQRTRALLQDCIAAHFNSIRVWGGGYYPDDYFYDICDELGLVVWQDFMFACAAYHLTEPFEENVTKELEDNIRRIRNHPCLGLWCGNNEMEMFADVRTWVSTDQERADYIKMYEYIFPKTLRRLDKNTFYWPSSSSSGGSFDQPNAANRGDVHYWDVWHGSKPFTEYRKFLFRFVSEFGFQSFPPMKTIEAFTLPEDRNIFSYVMEKHQRNNAANGKIMNYLAQTFLYPNSFESLVYASQLLQAEAIRYGVEHWRRNRGVCMGAIYWQLNDCWPVASWSSIDYFGRWKALHYYAKRFFAPLLLSCSEEGFLTQGANINCEPFAMKKSVTLNVANETMQEETVLVKYALRDSRATVISYGERKISVPALSSQWLATVDYSDCDEFSNYVSYELWQNHQKISESTALFVPPKYFKFADPKLKVKALGKQIIVHAAAYAKSVEIVCTDGDVVLSDNFFDLNGNSKTVTIVKGEGKSFFARSVYDIR